MGLTPVKVRWTEATVWVPLDRSRPKRRAAGDEDFMSPVEARNFAVCGMVEVVDDGDRSMHHEGTKDTKQGAETDRYLTPGEYTGGSRTATPNTRGPRA